MSDIEVVGSQGRPIDIIGGGIRSRDVKVEFEDEPSRDHVEVVWQVVADARAQEITDLRTAVANLAVMNCRLRQQVSDLEAEVERRLQLLAESEGARAALAALRRESGADDEFGELVAAAKAELKTGAVA